MIIALEKPYHFYRLDRNIDVLNLNNTLDDLYARKQEKKFTITTSTPSASTMTEGEIVILDQTSNERLFIKIDSGSVYYTTVLTEL